MKISKLTRRSAKGLFRSCLANGALDEARVRQTVTAVLAQKPRHYLAILEYFQRLVRWDIQRRTVRVDAAVLPQPGLQRDMEQNLSRRYGTGLQFFYQQNSALIGGLRIQVGSDVFDGSIRARLTALQQRF